MRRVRWRDAGIRSLCPLAGRESGLQTMVCPTERDQKWEGNECQGRRFRPGGGGRGHGWRESLAEVVEDGGEVGEVDGGCAVEVSVGPVGGGLAEVVEDGGEVGEVDLVVVVGVAGGADVGEGDVAGGVEGGEVPEGGAGVGDGGEVVGGAEGGGPVEELERLADKGGGVDGGVEFEIEGAAEGGVTPAAKLMVESQLEES